VPRLKRTSPCHVRKWNIIAPLCYKIMVSW
jgi:hypothetical protein